MQSRKEIVIVGDGVVGFTTGILLSLSGFDAKIISEKPKDQFKQAFFGGGGWSAAPELASHHAIASVLPHKIDVTPPLTVSGLSNIANRFFKRMYRTGACGVIRQRHYAMYEGRRPDAGPFYSCAEFGCIPVESTEQAPRRMSFPETNGWSFDIYFVEAPLFIQKLYQLFELAGGQVVFDCRVLDLDSLRGDAIVNCAGASAWQLAKERVEEQQIVRGHYLKVHLNDLPRLTKDAKEEVFSYTYYPVLSAYPCTDGTPDVYFYPRSDCWILGGSRQTGPMPKSFEGWTWPTGDSNYQNTVCDTLPEDGGVKDFPDPILRINKEILHDTMGVDIDRFPRSLHFGYRPSRKSGLRLELDDSANVPVIHNYGHGGAGLSLSWGCAYEVIQLLRHVGFEVRPVVRPRSIGLGPSLGLLADLLEDIESDGKEGAGK